MDGEVQLVIGVCSEFICRKDYKGGTYGECPWGGQHIEEGPPVTPDTFRIEWVVGQNDAREEAQEEAQENFGMFAT